MKKICVFCGSRTGKRPEYIQAARSLAEEFVKRDITLVYGGANVGIMTEIANRVLELGGDAIGIIPQFIFDKGMAHNGLNELVVVTNMHARKAKMAEISDGFIALPGGLGTLEELFEMLTMSQMALHQKPCALLNVQGYYHHLSRFLDHAVDEDFIQPEYRRMLLMDEHPDKLMSLMQDYTVDLLGG